MPLIPELKWFYNPSGNKHDSKPNQKTIMCVENELLSRRQNIRKALPT